jgi:hypothetical protein
MQGTSMSNFQPATRRGDESASSTPDPRPIYLGREGSEAFCLLHEPAGEPSGAAVLICPPFGNSDNGSYMPRRTWAQHLAAAGSPALRLDLPATGDSVGSPRDGGVVESWLQSITDAATWLKATYGLRTGAIGLGLSGLLLTLAAGRGAPIDDLVLWATPARGRAFLRELRIFEAMLASRVYETESGDGASDVNVMPTQDLEDGSLESAGFLLSAETVSAIGAIDLAELEPGSGHGHRALLLDRDGLALEKRLTAALTDWGAEVSSAPGPGFWQMMAAPYESEAPEQVMETVDGWLDPGASPAAPAVNGSRPASFQAVEMVCAGTRLRESPLSVTHPHGRLLGVLTEPVDPERDRRLTIVLVNSGTLRRVGPNRMWVEAARRWAARGHAVLRFDLSRESDLSPEILGRWHPVHGRPGDLQWDHFDPNFPGHYTAALDALRERGIDGPVFLGGLSSGAYWSLEQLRTDDRVAGAALINCPVLRWNEQAIAQEDARKLRDWTTWRRVLRGNIPRERLLQAARSILDLVTSRAAAPPAAEVDEVDLLLRRLDAADQRLTFVFAAAEPLRMELDRTGRMADLTASPRVVVEHLDSPLKAHVLESVALQRDAHAALDRAIARSLDALSSSARGPAGSRQPA